MKRTYIATTQEAKALHDGTQTAIITKMRVQPPAYGCRISGNKCIIEEPNGSIHGWYNIPYAIGQEVVVREAWQNEAQYVDTAIGWGWELTGSYLYKANDTELSDDMIWRSPATMPVSAARTRFKIVSCEAVRVRDVHEDDALNILECKPVNTLGDDYYNYYRDYMGSKNELDWPWFGETKDGIFKSWQSYIIHKLGQSAWDNNDYVFYYKIEKI